MKVKVPLFIYGVKRKQLLSLSLERADLSQPLELR
jgi:hypothetical protein